MVIIFVVGFMHNVLAHVKKAVWCCYKAIHGPAGFSFGLYLLPTKNVC